LGSYFFDKSNLITEARKGDSDTSCEIVAVDTEDEKSDDEIEKSNTSHNNDDLNNSDDDEAKDEDETGNEHGHTVRMPSRLIESAVLSLNCQEAVRKLELANLESN